MNINTHNKLYNKSAIALILTSILVGSVLVGVGSGFISGVSGISGADYITLEGVAGNDYYDSRQYSYNVNAWANDFAVSSVTGYPALSPANMWFSASKSLRIGMTEFGEFATPANTGIAYGSNAAGWVATESWASTAINQALYIQGWVFYMNYTRAAIPRAIEAWALYSDLSQVEAARKVVSWVGNIAAGATGWSPTTGSLTTSGIEILYDSARLGVARCNVVIHDGFYNEDVAKITFTVVLNKDTKYMIVYKDVKILMDPKVLDLINELAFSERYEIDIARNLNPSNAAFIHWYHNMNQTVYQHPLTGSNLYDVVQAYDLLKNNVFFAAYWPNCTEFAVYSPLVPDLPTAGHTRILPNMPPLDPATNAIVDIPAPQNEPNTPWVIAQWRYQSYSINVPNFFPNMLHFLAKDANREIRFVEVAGMTDFNTGQPVGFRARDAQDPTQGVNSVDIEVRYLLDSVFNPEDLTDAPYSPFMWIGIGQSAATTDNAGGAAMADFGQWATNEPLGLFDRNDTAFPWTAPVIGMKGSIPWALDNEGNFASNYLETFSNTGKGTGNDATTFVRTGLNGFAFNWYDASTLSNSPPQPIAGGISRTGSGYTGYWYPSRNPLYNNWYNSQLGRWTSAWVPAAYGNTFAEGIITLGGTKANGITRYFNDFYFAISREGTSPMALVNGGVVTGSAPTSNGALPTIDYFPISTWASSTGTAAGFGYTAGYAVIAMARDINGTRGLAVYGWDGRDTYWAAAWASQYLARNYQAWIPAGTVSVVLKITYTGPDREPTNFQVVKALGTITEFGTNAFSAAYLYDNPASPATTWTGGITILPLPQREGYNKEWWYEKLPTQTIAKVDYDP